MSYKIDFEDFKEFWEKQPYLVLDTNVILDLYRASSKTTEDVLKNLYEVIDNIWIPYQVQKEFYENQKDVRDASYKKYTDVSESISNLLKKFNSELSNKFKRYGKFQFPKIHELRKLIEAHTDAIEKEAKEFRNKIKDEIEKNKKLLRNDPIQKFMQDLEKGEHIGEALSGSKLLEIYEEGEKRYAYNLPPGFEDKEKNKKDSSRTKQFGDLVIWKCILEKSKVTKSPLIFVTEDGKPDWWHITENKEIIEPRKELIAEFNEYTDSQNNFLMLPLSEFIRHISVINKLSSLHAEVELNAENIIMDAFNDRDSDVIDTLQFELMQNGQLDSYLSGGTLNDIEINEFISSSLNIDSVDFDEYTASIEGSIEIEVSADLEEAYSKNYAVDRSYQIYLDCDFFVELKLDFENDEYMINDFQVKNPEVIEASETNPIDITDYVDFCDVCNEKEGTYILFNEGMICDNCSSKNGFFICTNCGIVYRTEDYDGDGETCQKCR